MRVAARAAISGSRIWRTSARYAEPPGWSMRISKSMDCRTACEVPLVMNVPRPEYASTRPFSCRAFTASRTAVRLTPNFKASSRSEGSWSPAFSVPLVIDSSICCTICSYRRDVRTTLYMKPPALESPRSGDQIDIPHAVHTNQRHGGRLLPPRHTLLCKSRSPFDRNGLYVHELSDSEQSQLSAVARAFHSAERQPWVRCDHAVDEDHP